MVLMSDIMPAIYLGHGAPPLLEDDLWVEELKQWSARLPVPAAVLVISAHWETRPAALSAAGAVPLVYDFWGFPERFYRLTYPSSGSPELARRVASQLASVGVAVVEDESRGLDHGAWVPLMAMYPEPVAPVMQLSLPSLDPRELLRLGAALAPLRDEGVLIVGSGFFTHNLAALAESGKPTGRVPAWSREFDEWGREMIEAGDLDQLADFSLRAPASRLAHPRTEHFAPLFVTLGAAGADPVKTVISGFWYGLSKRSIQAG